MGSLRGSFQLAIRKALPALVLLSVALLLIYSSRQRFLYSNIIIAFKVALSTSNATIYFVFIFYKIPYIFIYFRIFFVLHYLVKNSCVQYICSPTLTHPIPMYSNSPFIIFALCVGDFIHALTTSAGVS